MEREINKILVIICAKKNSKRFPSKNEILMDDVIKECLRDKRISRVALATDIERFLEMGDDKLSVLMRPKNALEPEDSVFLIARWVYLSMGDHYDIVSVVLPSVIGFKSGFIKKTADILVSNNLNEVRTYNNEGVENGVITMRSECLKSSNVSTYCGALITKAHEVHLPSELR